jgi:hypothetical protein
VGHKQRVISSTNTRCININDASIIIMTRRQRTHRDEKVIVKAVEL